MDTQLPFRRNSAADDRLLITAMDGFRGHLRVHFNPKEIEFAKTVQWQEKKAAGCNEPTFEYTAGGTRTMTMELFFDSFELPGVTIEPELQTLARMTLALDPQSKKDEERRPPHLEVTHGPIPSFRCVIESLTVKVQMFDKKMRPVRATANVKFKELGRGDNGALRPNNAGGGISERADRNYVKREGERGR